MAIVEGPIIAVIAGLLCTNGFLNLYMVYPIIIAGDIIGDSLCYALGRWGKSDRFAGIRKFFGLYAERIDRVRSFFVANPIRTISLSKVVLGVGVAGIFLAGNAKIPYNKFLATCLVTSAIQYACYLAIGLLFGHAYIQINHYLNDFASISILSVMAIILFFTLKSLLKRL